MAISSERNPVSKKVWNKIRSSSVQASKNFRIVRRVDLDLFIRCLRPVAFSKFDVSARAAHCLQHHDDSLVGRLLVEALFAARCEQDHDVRPIKTGDKMLSTVFSEPCQIAFVCL